MVIALLGGGRLADTMTGADWGPIAKEIKSRRRIRPAKMGCETLLSTDRSPISSLRSGTTEARPSSLRLPSPHVDALGSVASRGNRS